MQPLECQRARFTIPAEVHYINCAYMGPLPRVTQEAGIAGLQRKAVPAGIGPRDFFEDADRARALFADLIHAEPEGVAIVPAVSYGAATIARNLRPERGRRVIIASEQFPSNVYAWRRMAARHGLDVTTVAPATSEKRGESWNEALLAAIDDRAALIALPQVHWTDGTRFDLEAIGAAARKHDAVFVIDGSQSVGAMPFDVARVQPDAVLCAGYKWLLGPYGLSFLWLGPRFADAEPLEETWIGRRDSEDFRGLVTYRDEYQSGAARFDVGERSNFIMLPMIVASLQLIREWTPERIQEYCGRISEPVLAEATELGFSIEDADVRANHIFGLRLPPGIDVSMLQGALQEHNVHVSLRGSAVRISPNVYNDANDMMAFGAVLRAATAAVT